LNDTQVLIWDNSPDTISDSERDWLKSNFRSAEHHHYEENQPLSKVYNEIIETRIKKSNEFDYLLLLDQDSTLPSNFLEEANQTARLYPDVELFIPTVLSHGHIVSPAYLIYFKGFYMSRKHIGRLELKFKSAVNSGMLISTKYLSTKFHRYPSELSFYGTDDWFCRQFAHNHGSCFVLDAEILHNLSTFNEENIDGKLWRHREIIRANRFLNRASRLTRWGCLLYTSLVCARLALRYRDRRFLAC
jgi:GT2 family glycosyltransferase